MRMLLQKSGRGVRCSLAAEIIYATKEAASRAGGKAVTIIAGFKGYDGIVLCSDTQETIEQSHKRRVSKLRIEPSQENGETELAVAFCGSGNNGPFIDKIIGLAWEDIQTATSLDEACDELEKSIKKTYKEYGQIYQRGYCPEVELIYGVKMHSDNKLFHACGPVVNETTYYAAGAGQYMADFLSAKMFSEYMDVRHLEIVAAYVLFQAKEYVDGCGGDSEIAILRNEGRSGFVQASFIEGITETLSWSDKDLARALMLCADFGMSNAKFRKELKNTVFALESSRGLRMNKLKEERDMARKMGRFLGFVEVDDVGIAKPGKSDKAILKKMVERLASEKSESEQ